MIMPGFWSRGLRPRPSGGAGSVRTKGLLQAESSRAKKAMMDRKNTQYHSLVSGLRAR